MDWKTIKYLVDIINFVYIWKMTSINFAIKIHR